MQFIAQSFALAQRAAQLFEHFDEVSASATLHSDRRYEQTRVLSWNPLDEMGECNVHVGAQAQLLNKLSEHLRHHSVTLASNDFHGIGGAVASSQATRQQVERRWQFSLKLLQALATLAAQPQQWG